MTAPALFSRRSFLFSSLRAGLGLGLAGACACYFPAGLLAATSAAPAAADPARTAGLSAEFAGVSQGAEAWLAPRLGAARAQRIAADSRTRFAALLPSIPDIGPANRNQESLMQAVWLTAITQAMRALGLPEKDAGRLMYDLCEEEMRNQPQERLRARGQALFSQEGRAELAAWAEDTRKRRHPGDWVAKAVFGDGDAFDLGYDYSECGAVKFFQAHGVGAVAPYFCLNDFVLSRAEGTGLTRRHTIAQGDSLCDFRYKKDGPVHQSWDTETPRFAKRQPQQRV
ncbi:MAG TPA: L-2-amino-thiazoline-4-carboxylic acid hydrolase [Humidesulfovibrio sp.]|uniref:L-2-amino-thiazoline-4-carboxylic acid hydrolase n=1 Tax=Humidesulfovibrio sp. TaxID=2910988 RepID=UPI002B709EEF|nr:L-2-amino-thiazoline-4-carboxylic acid hydrolase [Humidesulfovibrio sp.]HWR03068.1 L-2-amino-thiazoline-4-carboxylic acid hydrolase [Humidesulfovibrio sp.]